MAVCGRVVCGSVRRGAMISRAEGLRQGAPRNDYCRKGMAKEARNIDAQGNIDRCPVLTQHTLHTSPLSTSFPTATHIQARFPFPGKGACWEGDALFLPNTLHKLLPSPFPPLLPHHHPHPSPFPSRPAPPPLQFLARSLSWHQTDPKGDYRAGQPCRRFRRPAMPASQPCRSASHADQPAMPDHAK